MWNLWNDVFKKTLGQAQRTLVSELRDVRNKWAHQRPFSTDDAYRSLDSMNRLLTAVSAGKEADELQRQKTELLRLKFDEQARHEKRKAASTAIEGQSVAGLKPWREVVTPHPDVASGRYQQAEFAADLWQVYKGLGSDEYRNPIEFFRRTFLTAGLKDLLVQGLLRLNGNGGDPVVELQTNFEGGKTPHSMLALFHLFSGTRKEDLAGLDPVFAEAKVSLPAKLRRVVVVGNRISPGQPDKKDDGTVVRTLWGELACQLGGKEGYAMIKQADETATNPGDAFGKLLGTYSPCLILIDEWVAYARQLHDTKDLPGGDFETQFTFAQTLSEEIKSAPNVLLVVSIPASTDENGASPSGGVHDEEVGGAKGREALARLRNVFQRIATQWRPASSEESYEIVRSRLFQPITDPQLFIVRDRVAKEFCDPYLDENLEERPMSARNDENRNCAMLRRFWASIRYVDVSDPVCDSYFEWRKAPGNLKQGKDRRMTDRELNTLNNAFKYAKRRGLIRVNPLADRPRYQKSTSVTHCREFSPRNADELHPAATLLFQHPHSVVLAFQLLIEAYTGLRTKEVLQWGEDHFGTTTEDGKNINVWRLKGQHHNNPYCTNHEGLQAVLKAHAAWKSANYPDSPWFFPSHCGGVVGKGSLAHALRRLLKAGKLKRNLTSHGTCDDNFTSGTGERDSEPRTAIAAHSKAISNDKMPVRLAVFEHDLHSQSNGSTLSQ